MSVVAALMTLAAGPVPMPTTARTPVAYAFACEVLMPKRRVGTLAGWVDDVFRLETRQFETRLTISSAPKGIPFFQAKEAFAVGNEVSASFWGDDNVSQYFFGVQVPSSSEDIDGGISVSLQTFGDRPSNRTLAVGICRMTPRKLSK